MKTVVITGSTRGIGRGLAREFLARGHQVVVCGRGEGSTGKVVAELSKEYDAARIFGQPCDVGDYEQVQALWDAAVAHFGRVDTWINNAGLGNPMFRFWDLQPEMIDQIVRTNLTGLMYATKVAINGMLKQSGGQVYNMEGFGSNGRTRDGLTLYGSTKAAVRFFTESMISETKETPVQVGTLSPGIVITDLLVEGYAGSYEDMEAAKRIFNVLGDKVETVTPWLVDQILANEKHGARIAWLTGPKIMTRFLTAPFNKRDLFTEPASD